MSRRNVARRVAVLVGASAIVACSGDSPMSPDAPRVPGGGSGFVSHAAAVTYQLDFFVSGPGGLQPVSSLPVLGSELILGAHIEDQAGRPAQRGNVVFQYCSLKGLPPNDIDRADEAPSARCADGSASWANLGSVPVNASGNAFLNFGIVRIPRVVGFRCRYVSQGSSVASGVCSPRDFTWTAAP